MREQLKEFIRINTPDLSQSKLLVGVSGGIDSMVLLNLLISAGYSCQVAHCNFGLRGEESDHDEHFVSQFCKNKGIKFHSVRFETESYSRIHGISIQMAARDLRYEWFEKVREEFRLDYICLAHNKNDIVETFIINLLRGTGINGLTGISALNGKLIRPMLFASREMIELYAANEKIEHREDSSNSEIKYLRNRVRHLILPQFEKIQPDHINSVYETIERLREAAIIYSNSIESARATLVKTHNDYDSIDKAGLRELSPLNTFIYELFKPYGTTSQQIGDVVSLLDSDTGKRVLTREYQIISDRERILISPLKDPDSRVLIIENEDQFLNIEEFISVRRVTHGEFKAEKGGKVSWIDGDRIEYPLTIRLWRKGDKFHPFGMKGKKKLSDLLIDEKMPINQKAKIRVLLSLNEIVWVIGIRSDNRFRVRDESTNILELTVPD